MSTEIPKGKKLNRYGELENIELTVEDWITCWEKKHIGFHKNEIHRLLKKHLNTILNGRKQITIFVPLCGKSWDIKWFRDQGHKVVGVEVCKIAIEEFFTEQNLYYTKEAVPEIPGAEVFKSADGHISLYNCDVFDFSSLIAGKFDGIWDSNSLIAINPPDRCRYVKLMTSLMAEGCCYLLDSYTFNENLITGPPFSVPKDTIEGLYAQSCNIQWMESIEALGELQISWGLDSFIEEIYLITLKTSAQS
ncbi:probable thiopurine S-methyltransferase [Narcine bancroftii]|uniref:probable thiopurine S-methyltransferase n=1 Tax=Narcine bancroftii TaxID=1343680 RepID=UPI0038320164